MNKIGGKIRKLRDQMGFSQESMAFELGLTQPSYARLEKEDERISVKFHNIVDGISSPSGFSLEA
jgi:transcriptional regulator with XRE-family HTH domain